MMMTMMMMMMYTGALRMALQLPVAHEIEPKACTRLLWLPLYGPCVISEHVEINITRIILLLSMSAWVLLSHIYIVVRYMTTLFDRSRIVLVLLGIQTDVLQSVVEVFSFLKTFDPNTFTLQANKMNDHQFTLETQA